MTPTAVATKSCRAARSFSLSQEPFQSNVSNSCDAIKTYLLNIAHFILHLDCHFLFLCFIFFFGNTVIRSQFSPVSSGCPLPLVTLADISTLQFCLQFSFLPHPDRVEPASDRWQWLHFYLFYWGFSSLNFLFILTYSCLIDVMTSLISLKISRHSLLFATSLKNTFWEMSFLSGP